LPALSRKRERMQLPARREPYWQRLAKAAALGFRRGPDTWIVRVTGRDGKKTTHALTGVIEFDDAREAAENWVTRLTGTAVRTVKRATVRAALDAYLAYLRQQGRPDAARDAAWRFKLYIDKDDTIHGLKLENATHDDFLEWRDRQRSGRTNRTVNRNVRAVIAGLNKANKELGHVGNPAAWRLEALRDDVEDDGETAIFLNAEQRKALIGAASANGGEFMRGLELSGARPMELAAAKAGDFDGEKLRLAHRKGKLPKLKVRYVVLGEDGVKFFSAQAKDKLPSAPLFTEDGEQPWRRHVWCRHVRAAIKAHNAKARGANRIPAGASAYSFRHARISELLQVHNVDPLTVALQTGTSVVMIEKSYLSFIPSAMREKLAGLKAA